jgi:hypothetical protein
MITGKRGDIERITPRLEEGRWKRIGNNTSLAAYPTARPVSRGGSYSNVASLPDPGTAIWTA